MKILINLFDYYKNFKHMLVHNFVFQLINSMLIKGELGSNLVQNSVDSLQIFSISNAVASLM